MANERTLTVGEAKAFYDRIGAGQDWQWFYEDPALDRLIARADFQSAHSIVEFGCGTGRFAQRVLAEIAPADCRYLGIDVSLTMVALAERRLAGFADRARVRLSDGATRIQEPDASFDRFVSNYVFDLLSREQITSLLGEAYRVLSPGGRLCVVSLTHGRSTIHKLISRSWHAIHRMHPALVGGCRPIELLDFLPTSNWRVDHLEVVTAFGLSSEMLVASRRWAADQART